MVHNIKKQRYMIFNGGRNNLKKYLELLKTILKEYLE